jgi:hypothetical protein
VTVPHLGLIFEGLVVIPDEIRECVCFVGLQKADGSFVLAGTAFLMIRPMEAVPHTFLTYAVTAKHVIEGIKGKGVDSVFLRMNIKSSGAAWIRAKAGQTNMTLKQYDLLAR